MNVGTRHRLNVPGIKKAGCIMDLLDSHGGVLGLVDFRNQLYSGQIPRPTEPAIRQVITGPTGRPFEKGFCGHVAMAAERASHPWATPPERLIEYWTAVARAHPPLPNMTAHAAAIDRKLNHACCQPDFASQRKVPGLDRQDLTPLPPPRQLEAEDPHVLP